MVRRMPERLALLEKPARADAELEAPIRKKVDRRGLLRERDGVRGDERHDRDAESHALGRSRDESERDHRVGPCGLCVPRRDTVVAIRITRLERRRHDGMGVRPDRIEPETLRGLCHTEDRFATWTDVRGQHHAETHGAQFRRAVADRYRTVVVPVTTRITIKTDALMAKMPSSNTANTRVLSRVPRSTGRFSIWARSLLIILASPPSGAVRRYPLPDRG